MHRYTVRDILALRPCQPTEDEPDDGYPESKLRGLFGDRQLITLLNICDDERVPIEDRQWVLHRLLPDRIVHEAACRYAEHALERERAAGREPDPRSWAAIEAKRRWLRGEISSVELAAARDAAEAAARDAVEDTAWDAAWAARDAAEAAARDAVEDAAWDAAEAAAEAAARDAAEAAAWAVAQTAERRWQLNTLREMIEEMEDRNYQQGENP